MKHLKLYQKVLAGLLAALGFSACTTEQPDLYGPLPVLYGPLPLDSTEARPLTRSVEEDEIVMPAPDSEDDELTADEPA
jgi:hypothetical protein